MNDEMPHDDELRALYRKLPANEPRAELDNAILTAARRRNDKERRRALVRRLRWTIPMAAAAGVVLTLTLTRLTPEQLASPAAFVPKQTASSRPWKLEARSQASSDEMREETAPAAQPEQFRSLGYLGDEAPDAPPAADSGAAGIDVVAPERQAARKDAAPIPAEKPASTSSGAPRNAASAHVAAPTSSGPSDSTIASAPAAAPPPPAATSGAAYGEAAPADSAHAKSRAIGQMAKTAPAPEAKELDSADRAASAQPEAETATGGHANAAPAVSSYGAFEAPVPAPAAPPAVEPWPFGLEAGLDAKEACRRVSSALHVGCEFHAGLVVLPVEPPATIDRGPHAGRRVSRLTLTLHDDRLWSVVLELPLADGTSEQVALIAREQATKPRPE